MATINPGPAITQTFEPVAPMGNVQKWGEFPLSLTPAATTASTTAAQTFSSTGIGLQTTDYVQVSFFGAQTAGVFVANAYVSATDTLVIQFGNVTASTPTPASGTYIVTVYRVAPQAALTSSPALSW